MNNYPSFDPYQMLLKRKAKGEDTQMPPIVDYDPNDVYELEQFCQKHNIIGFNCGRMNPKAALNMLRRKIGVKYDETSTPRVFNKRLLNG